MYCRVEDVKYLRKIVTVLRRGLRQSRVLQILLIALIWLMCDTVSVRLKLPIPGSVLGIFALLALFASRALTPHDLESGANWLLAEMMLFFVPAIVAVTNHPEFLGSLGLKLIVVIALGTIVVMTVTALVVEFCVHKLSRRPDGLAP